MSQRTVKGVISRVDGKDFPSRSGSGSVTLYSFQLEGSNQWFRAGEKPLNVARGDQVEFVADGQKVDRSTLVKVQSVAQSSPPVPSASVGTVTATSLIASARGLSKDEYWANKEARDLAKEERYQAVSEPRMALSVAVEAASRVIVAALANDGIGFGQAAKSKRLGLLSKYVKETALDLAVFIQNAPEELANYRASLSDVVEVTDDVKGDAGE